MSGSSPIRTISFDADGTLVDSNDLHADAWAEAFRRLGFDVAVDRVGGQICTGGDNSIPALLPPLAETRREKIGTDFVAIAIAGSAPAAELDHLDRPGCRHLVAGTTSTDDVASFKPDPDLFAAASREAGTVAWCDDPQDLLARCDQSPPP